MLKTEIIVGIDIGGTNTGIGFIDEAGNFLLEDSIPTSPDESADKFVVRLAGRIQSLYKKYESLYSLSGIGIAAPCANHFRGTIESPSNLKWGYVNFVKMMSSHFDMPVDITNDANAAALGESFFGAAKGMKNFIVITLGTGLGSGIVIDREILYGENGLAGELGHTIVIANGRKCNCGRSGCLETYASASGLRRTVLYLLSHSNEESVFHSVPFKDITAKMICDYAKEGDPVALEAFNFTGEILGQALANAAAAFDSEAIILFGGLMNAGELLLEPTRKYFEKNLLSIYKGKVKILRSDLHNGRAAILGAASLILKEKIKNSGSEAEVFILPSKSGS